MRELDRTDQKLLTLLQRGLPLTMEPYKELGEQLGGLSGEQVRERIARLKREGLIRRLSGFFDSRKLGYTSLLCAMTVPPEHLQQMAGLLESIPGITHNYERAHPLNLWFTLCCPDEESLDKTLARIQESGWTDKVHRFPCQRLYKVLAAFDLKEEEPWTKS